MHVERTCKDIDLGLWHVNFNSPPKFSFVSLFVVFCMRHGILVDMVWLEMQRLSTIFSAIFWVLNLNLFPSLFVMMDFFKVLLTLSLSLHLLSYESWEDFGPSFSGKTYLTCNIYDP
jgi:hypothetical protein